MSIVTAEVSLPGPVPYPLSSLLEKWNEEQEVKQCPNKRRKLSKTHVTVRQENTASGERIPGGYIPLAHFTLGLNFANPGSVSRYIDLPHHIPILTSINAHGNLGMSDERVPFTLTLQEIPEKSILFRREFSEPRTIDFMKRLYVHDWLVSIDNYSSNSPPASFRLETTILWKDSLEIPSQITSRIGLAHYKFVEQGRPNAQLDFFPRGAPKLRPVEWSPREFYDNVHVPEDTSASSSEIKCNQIRAKLLPFQRRAVRWLLQREGMELKPDGRVVPIEKTESNHLPASFVEIKDLNGRTCFSSQLYSIMTTDLSGWNDAANYVKGGILAEEMGLGKTVEIISLICLNRLKEGGRAKKEENWRVSSNDLRESGATLIITPPAILEQWKQEIKRHATGLRVFHYTGFRDRPDLTNEELVDVISDHDIVLTSYDVLSREVYFSVDPPKRNLRHEKKFEQKKTPLVQILWWRVCLDEAQMVESGVSNAAKVALMIPRQNAWAVTGTPLRSNISDLFGLFVFLNYTPICDSSGIWNRLHQYFKPVFADIINQIALRHSKDNIRGQLHLPPQKRVVITVPFSAVEEQHYQQLYDEMCEDCGLDATGSPLKDSWDPSDAAIVEKMRSWLMRLRQTCLHPEMVAGKDRILGAKKNPLRSAAEVLEVMLDQNDTQIRSEERALLLYQLRRGQLLENAMRRKEALDLWTAALQRASEIVKDCRDQLQSELDRCRTGAAGTDGDMVTGDTPVDDDEIEKNTRIGTSRNRLRAALEVQHICTFFIGNAYYQIKTDPKLTAPDSPEFRDLEKREVEAYEAAKLIRKEILADVSGKVGRHMRMIKDRVKRNMVVNMPTMKPSVYAKGVEGRLLLDRFEDFCAAMNSATSQYQEWRDIMIKLLLQPLVDQEEDEELQGDEYEKSTKHQDEMYVYMEALRAMVADLTHAVTGQRNNLIDHEVKTGIALAKKGEGPSPKLFLEIMGTRRELIPGPEIGPLRGIIGELRSLATSLEWQESGGSSRARAELENINAVLSNASHMATERSKTLVNLEREIEMFRDTMNNRLEYYRQLQQISDTVAPYDEESVGQPLDEQLFTKMLQDEAHIEKKVYGLKAKRRYLIHLRDEPESDDGSRICIICQSSFEIGVLTVCGHKYCRDCLLLWWRQHRNCPSCKTHLKTSGLHQITYRPQDLVVQEEKPSDRAASKSKPGRHSKNSIYKDISSGDLSEIKTIDLDGSFGTKIDTLSRHILWLRQHDPGAKSIVFSQFKNFLGVLESAFSRFKIGYTSIDNKDGIERFRSDPAIECFLLHAKAHSSGLNLVNATHVFLCEPLVNTAIELQAIARVHRIGQQRPTTVWMYLVTDTVEESIYDLSVSRRLAHIVKEVEDLDSRTSNSKSRTKGDVIAESLTETAIDSANSREMQDAALTKLMAGGASGGELVQKDDLWECLFGNASRRSKKEQKLEAQQEIGRFLRGEAAEERRAASSP
ncbi:hypothetical protein MPDQ_001626 [Monascus purpureus]|uniref:SNF2 family helicase/ATPase n=1 Tax=Monascus purpureus TaxID=5098 RepID=A0A507QM53_MONPU|nr:hypothetical protein MPDQ_001626 [Monascus purpureus]